MLPGYAADKKQAEPGSFDTQHVASGNAIEAPEDAFVLVGRQAYAGIGNAQRCPGVVSNGERAANANTFGGIFHSVIQQVEHGDPEILCDSHHPQMNPAGYRLQDNGVGGEVMTLKRDRDAFGDEGFQIDQGAALLAMTLQ